MDEKPQVCSVKLKSLTLNSKIDTKEGLEIGKPSYPDLEYEAPTMGRHLPGRKVGCFCHFVVTGCVSLPGTLPDSSGETDTDTGTGTVSSLTLLWPVFMCECVCV